MSYFPAGTRIFTDSPNGGSTTIVGEAVGSTSSGIKFAESQKTAPSIAQQISRAFALAGLRPAPFASRRLRFD
jgi:hypothetical protein